MMDVDHPWTVSSRECQVTFNTSRIHCDHQNTCLKLQPVFRSKTSIKYRPSMAGPDLKIFIDQGSMSGQPRLLAGYSAGAPRTIAAVRYRCNKQIPPFQTVIIDHSHVHTTCCFPHTPLALIILLIGIANGHGKFIHRWLMNVVTIWNILLKAASISNYVSVVLVA